jgi:hypothetical protein
VAAGATAGDEDGGEGLGGRGLGHVGSATFEGSSATFCG